MPRTLFILAALLSLTTTALAASPPSTPAATPLPIAVHSDRCASHSSSAQSAGLTGLSMSTAQTCCKICHKGKACGNTCISRQDICHVGPGCACDG